MPWAIHGQAADRIGNAAENERHVRAIRQAGGSVVIHEGRRGTDAGPRAPNDAHAIVGRAGDGFDGAGRIDPRRWSDGVAGVLRGRAPRSLISPIPSDSFTLVDVPGSAVAVAALATRTSRTRSGCVLEGTAQFSAN